MMNSTTEEAVVVYGPLVPAPFPTNANRNELRKLEPFPEDLEIIPDSRPSSPDPESEFDVVIPDLQFLESELELPEEQGKANHQELLEEHVQVDQKQEEQVNVDMVLLEDQGENDRELLEEYVQVDQKLQEEKVNVDMVLLEDQGKDDRESVEEHVQVDQKLQEEQVNVDMALLEDQGKVDLELVEEQERKWKQEQADRQFALALQRQFNLGITEPRGRGSYGAYNLRSWTKIKKESEKKCST